MREPTIRPGECTEDDPPCRPVLLALDRADLKELHHELARASEGLAYLHAHPTARPTAEWLAQYVDDRVGMIGDLLRSAWGADITADPPT